MINLMVFAAGGGGAGRGDGRETEGSIGEELDRIGANKDFGLAGGRRHWRAWERRAGGLWRRAAHTIGIEQAEGEKEGGQGGGEENSAKSF